MNVPPDRTRRARCAIAVLTALLAAPPVCPEVALATTRLVRDYNVGAGLPTAPIHSLAQDTRGFIWIGTQGGLVRYDGHEFRRWAPDLLAVDISFLAAGPRGEVFGVSGSGQLFEVTPRDARLVTDQEGQLVGGVTRLAFDHRGTLWIAAGGTMRYREPDGRWGRIPSSAHGNDPVRIVCPAGSMLYVASRTAVWRLERDPWRGRRFAVADVEDGMLATPDGTVWLGTLHGAKTLTGDRLESVPGVSARAGPFALRGSTMWISTVDGLVALRHGEAPVLLGPGQGVHNAGALLVDHERGLWLGSYLGVLHFPEPDTVTWGAQDGLPGFAARRVVVSPRGVWIQTWQGLARLERVQGTWRLYDESAGGWDALCLDQRGQVWTPGPSPGTYVRRTGDIALVRSAPVRSERVLTCAPSPAGGVWMAQASDIVHVSAEETSPLLVPAPQWPTPQRSGRWIDTIYEDRRGGLWATNGPDVCRVEVAGLAQLPAGHPPSWSCRTLPGTGEVLGFTQLPSGAIWAATRFGGVWRLANDVWSVVPASLEMDTRWFNGFAPGNDGGVWVLGGGRVTLAREDNGVRGWHEVRRLGPGDGYGGVGVSDLVEDRDGTIWLASSAGITRIPATASNRQAPPPTIVAEAFVDGAERSLADFGEFDAGQTLELRISVPSFRDRRRLRIDARLGPGIAWLPLHEWDPTLRLPVLAPGHYELETRASVDGTAWSAGPRAAFRVRPPWYQRWWARLGAMALAVGAGVLLYRVRVGFGLRLQEQRARIARDLHDELGSGLGSIGIVAAVAGGDGLSEPERRRLTATIADTATDLGNALSDIVWSLRPGPSSLRDLCHYLAHRAGLLFPGSLPTLTIDFPSEWPEQELSLLLRRDILLIGVEALRNAARHSEADRVLLRVAPAEGTWWTLVVEDNGRGFAPLAPRGDSGVHGLDNMQRRADEIHGQLVIGAAESGGTRVALRFRLEGSLVRPRSRQGRTRLAGS